MAQTAMTDFTKMSESVSRVCIGPLIPLGLGDVKRAQNCVICRFASSRIISAHRFVSFKI